MWEQATLHPADLVDFLNKNRIKPGEFVVLSRTETRVPDQQPAIDIVFFKKPAGIVLA
ncbi:hypothetical protein GYA54_03720 [Candidatus Kuenenbacteria bacterium]|nr:hypothetical protein [Candidatus Kuenenbacteria bacterium]